MKRTSTEAKLDDTVPAPPQISPPFGSNTGSRGHGNMCSVTSASIASPPKKQDKGKGKMKHLPELPEDVWMRIWAIYYQDLAKDWHDKLSYTGALTPLLVSPDHIGAAMTSLYSHPLISYEAITPFLLSISSPSSFNFSSPASLIRHLTIKPTPVTRDKDSVSPTSPRNIHACFTDVLERLPYLISFTLKDTLITGIADAKVLFEALNKIQPRKARLEVRMWDLTDSLVGRDIRAALRQSIHTSGPLKPAETDDMWAPPTNDAPPTARRYVVRDTGNIMLEQWRSALWKGINYDFPQNWLDPVRRDANGNPIQGNQNQNNNQNNNNNNNNHQAWMIPPGVTINPHTGVGGIGSGNGGGAGGTSSGTGVTGGPGSANRPIIFEYLDDEDSDASTPTPPRMLHIRDRIGASSLRRMGQGGGSSSGVGNIHSRSRVHQDSTDVSVEGGINGNAGQTPIGGSRSFDQPTTAPTTANPDVNVGAPLTLATPSTLPAVQSGSEQVNLGDDGLFNDDDALTDDDLVVNLLAPSRHDNQSQPTASSGSSTRLESQSNPRSDDTAAPTRRSWNRTSSSLIASRPNRDLLGAATSSTTSDPADQYISQLSTWMRPRRAGMPSGSSTRADEQQQQVTRSSAGVIIAERALGRSAIRNTRNSEPPAFLRRTQEALDRQRRIAATITSSANAIATSNATAAFNRSTTSSSTSANWPINLPHTLRQTLADLLRRWTGRLEAFSYVALDPLASLVVRSPTLDFWPNVAIPHIRVHLPRGVEPLTVFKSAEDCARDRRRGISRSLADDLAGIGAGQGLNTNANGNVNANGNGNGADQDGDPAQSTSQNQNNQDEGAADRIIGGDGYGGGLLHPSVRLFEIEVNHWKQLNEVSWDEAAGQLPAVLCRILVGENDWEDVITGSQVLISPPTLSDSSPELAPEYDDSIDASSFEFDSDQGEGEVDEDEEEEVGESYDADAAKEQQRKLEERRLAKLNSGELEEDV